eukprot:CAMPEP_0117739670 /NCGR_PEP_ID=MMETSP0947-20121206/3893_1 /TAXON_ID=44440 /ORGANISM="Chattonella subsalsa, Strain CCMP2191" /LENGTH=1013 /DNA_ID=CAMNT_0005555655 /DNA_START=834 /DNA_END=3876 /DNA_ORIENTATION=-
MAQHGFLVFVTSKPVYFASFLGLESCVQMALTNSKLARALNPARVHAVREAAARTHFVGPQKRFGLWVWALGVKASQQRLLGDPVMQQRLPRPDSMVADVDCTDGQGAAYDCLDYLKPTGIQGEILRDITRTYPSHPLFKDSGVGPGQQMLANVLFACTHYHAKVGYCQGMNFVAGALLIAHMESTDATPGRKSRRWTRFKPKEEKEGEGGGNPLEGLVKIFSRRNSETGYPVAAWAKDGGRYINAMEDVFWVMTAILYNKLQMDKLWTKGVPQMKLRVFQFIEVLKAEMPQILTHLDRISLHPDILVTQWFLTLYAYTLPTEVVLKLWNSIFLDGWKAIFRIAVARLKEMESQILSLDLEDMSLFLRKLKNQNTAETDPSLVPDADALLKSSYTVDITNTKLKHLEQEFEVQLLKERLAIGSGKQGEWLLRYGAQEEENIDPTFIERMKMEIGNLTAPLRQDTPILQEKIVSAAQRLATLKGQLSNLERQMVPMQSDLEDLLQRKKLFHKQIMDMVRLYEEKHRNCKSRKPEVIRGRSKERSLNLFERLRRGSRSASASESSPKSRHSLTSGPTPQKKGHHRGNSIGGGFNHVESGRVRTRKTLSMPVSRSSSLHNMKRSKGPEGQEIGLSSLPPSWPEIKGKKRSEGQEKGPSLLPPTVPHRKQHSLSSYESMDHTNTTVQSWVSFGKKHSMSSYESVDHTNITVQSWVSFGSSVEQGGHRKNRTSTTSLGSQVLSFFFGGDQESRDLDRHHRTVNSEPSLFRATTIKLNFNPETMDSKYAPRPPGVEFVYDSDEEEENYFNRSQTHPPSLRPAKLDNAIADSAGLEWHHSEGSTRHQWGHSRVESMVSIDSHSRQQSLSGALEPLQTMMDTFNRMLLDDRASKELEELRSDVKVFRKRIAAVDREFEEEKGVFVQLLTQYETLKVEHDEALETKQALSNQLLQLIRESDDQVDKQLRKFADLFGGNKSKGATTHSRLGSDDTYFMGAPFLDESPRKKNGFNSPRMISTDS